MQPEVDIANYLANTVGSLTLWTNLFYGYVFPVDANHGVEALAVFVLLTGGQEPQPIGGNGPQSYSENRASLQIFIRGNTQDYPEAVALARTVFDVLKFGAISGYANVKPLQPGPIAHGLDKDKHPALSMNFEVMYYE